MSGQQNKRFDVVGIGNAIVDVIARTDDDFLVARGLHKGSMSLVEADAAATLRATMQSPAIVSGGSAANTIAGLASFGLNAAFVGKVHDDAAGHAFARDIRAAGVHFEIAPATDGPPTAQCLVLVTPDGERTMSTYLGACRELTPADVDPALIESSAMIYFEGYLWDPPAAKDAFRKAEKIAHAKGGKVAISLSDAFCVDRFRDEFLQLIRAKSVDVVFCNESELHALYQTADFATAVAALQAENVLGIVTRSEQGCVIVEANGTQSVAASPVEMLVDTTGAGDLFAAGFLAGMARGLPHASSAALGAKAAAQIIQHIGARPQVPLRNLIA